MGQSSSALPSSLPGLALHCLRVADSSPASGLVEPFFDYLIGVDTDPPTETGLAGLSPNELGRVLEENEGKRIVLRVYNAKSQRIRGESASKSGGKEETDGMGEEVELVPSRVWSEAALKQNGFPHEPVNGDGDGDEEKKPSLLGLSLRACNPAHALESVYHVLDVLEGSPAEMAGLVPWGDFVLAWSGGPLHSEEDFYNLIEAHVDRPLRLFVYNSDLDNLREVVLYPTRQWGGEGLIGCGIGYGLLHRIPRPVTPATMVFTADGYFGPDATRLGEGGNDTGTFVPGDVGRAETMVP